jgi:hypothetical protein
MSTAAENGGLSHSTLPGSAAFGTVGWPFDGVQSRIDPATGEIQQRSGGVMRGYFKQPELTAQVFTADGWLRTGDKGVVRTTDGGLQIVGRLKEQFKTSKGKYVALAPIQHQLMMHDSIDACIVVGANLPQPIGLVQLHEALAAPADPSARQQLSVSLERHLANVNDHLDPHERLDRLVVVDTPWTVQDGHLTPTLKIKRHRLPLRRTDPPLVGRTGHGRLGNRLSCTYRRPGGCLMGASPPRLRVASRPRTTRSCRRPSRLLALHRALLTHIPWVQHPVATGTTRASVHRTIPHGPRRCDRPDCV